jgi:hypothetical protein
MDCFAFARNDEAKIGLNISNSVRQTRLRVLAACARGLPNKTLSRAEEGAGKTGRMAGARSLACE